MIMNTNSRFSPWIAILTCLPSLAWAEQNLARSAEIQASSTLSKTYPARNAIDGIVDDSSRWLSADEKVQKTLTLTFPQETTVGAISLFSGWENSGAVESLNIQFRSGKDWVDIPSARFVQNDSQSVTLRFDEDVNTDALRFLFGDSGIVRVREIMVWPAGDTPNMETLNTISASPQALFVNQSGYNLEEPKRFTAIGFPDNTAYSILSANEGEAVYQGRLDGSIGDFSKFNPQSAQEYYIQAEGAQSDPFRIGPWWMERVAYGNWIRFTRDTRNFVGNVKKPAPKSYGWRDDHHFAFHTRSLVNLYLANPEAFVRLPSTISYPPPTDGKWGALEPYNENAPDIVKLIHWSADITLTQELKHEFFKGELAFFLYAWPWLKPWLHASDYEKVKKYALATWESPSVEIEYPYDESAPDGHNLLNLKTTVGTEKGAYPPGFSILPNALMAVVLEREGSLQAEQFRNAARKQVAWTIQSLNPKNPALSKAQRMHADILISSLVIFSRVDPAGTPIGFEDFINIWASTAIERSENIWDFYQLEDSGDWVVYEASHKTKWNDPGSLLALPAALLEASTVARGQERKARLREIAFASLDHLFGRNPTGRHASYDAPREIEGVERGWYSFHPGGIGQLKDVPFVFDGAPKAPHYPYHPEIGNIGWTEGWVTFNNALARSLAAMAYTSSTVQIQQVGETLEVKLKAPLNLDYEKPESFNLYLRTSSGRSYEVEMTETDAFSQIYAGRLELNKQDISEGEVLKTSYGYGYYEHSASITLK